MEEMQYQGRYDPLFLLLEPEEVKSLLLNDKRKCWSCAHCTVNAEEPWTRDAVLDHLWDTHDQSDVHVPADYFYASWGRN
ncbi:hypothetical protein PM082_024990 [Marasmius tenuissimus]|nr:hypothetical protein PM082_024990 [Marasmius tenuissimus]